MIPYLPEQISNRAILIYLISLAAVSIVFMSYSMQFGYIVLGCLWVLGFFLLVNKCSKYWRVSSSKVYVRSIFFTAFVLRVIWVIFSYYYYINATGEPFEFSAADSRAYHADAEWLADSPWSVTWAYLFGNYIAISDSGFPFYLSLVYRVFGPSIIISRLFNALISAFTCIIVYRISSRTFGEKIGRLAGIMMVFMPNLIIYCGYHLKETLMLFLTIACLDRIDCVIRSRNNLLLNVIISSLLIGSLFLFRTALGASTVFALASAILFSTAPTMRRNGRRAALIGWGVLALSVFGGGTIATEVEGLWEDREDNVARKRTEQTLRGNRWAHYATGTVMAPMAFVLPFATMVNVDEQYIQQEKSGGNYVRNFMGFFVFLAVYEAFRRKKWRDFTMIGSFTIAYLGIVSVSAFSNSERFLLPALPCLIMMWAYGVSTLRKETFKLLTPWCIIVFLMEFAWAYFKLGSRGLF